jgi:hypothetical protein
MKGKGRYRAWLTLGIFCVFVILPCAGYGANLSIGDTVSTTGNWTVNGNITATSISGDGSGLTSVDAEMFDSKRLSGLDTRYGVASPIQNPRSNTITTIDSGGYVGYHTSITIGTDGLPVISYYDWTIYDLKVAKCANPFCLNNWSRRQEI